MPLFVSPREKASQINKDIPKAEAHQVGTPKNAQPAKPPQLRQQLHKRPASGKDVLPSKRNQAKSVSGKPDFSNTI
jgi:hypothetical protein